MLHCLSYSCKHLALALALILMALLTSLLKNEQTNVISLYKVLYM